jgi:Uma2 family endonuclease
MLETGITREGARVELINGEIVRMAAFGGQHVLCVNRSTCWFSQTLGASVRMRVQNPVTLSTDGEPEPDIAIRRFCADCYSGTPPPDAVLLLVEVADSALLMDCRTELPFPPLPAFPGVDRQPA